MIFVEAGLEGATIISADGSLRLVGQTNVLAED